MLNTFGAGFLGKVYENALACELRKSGLAVVQQHGVTVLYEDFIVGQYTVDLLVEETVMVEVKAIELLEGTNAAQCINYLKGTGLPLCLLLNFGKSRLEIQHFANWL